MLQRGFLPPEVAKVSYESKSAERKPTHAWRSSKRSAPHRGLQRVLVEDVPNDALGAVLVRDAVEGRDALRPALSEDLGCKKGIQPKNMMIPKQCFFLSK